MTPVVWITQVYPRRPGDLFGGFLHRLARELPSRGFRTVVLAPGAPGAAAREALDGVEIVRFEAAEAARAGLVYSGQMHVAALRSPLAFARFLHGFRSAAAALVAEVRPCLLHAHWWFPGGWVAAPLAGNRRPLVVSLHGTDVRLLARVPLARWVARRVLRRTATVLPVSESLRSVVDPLLSRGTRQTVLPMPADASCFRAGEPDGPRAPAFVVAARLTRQKRVDLAIRAVDRLKRAGSPVRLDVAGDGPDRERLSSLVESLDVGDRVRFHGALESEALARLFRSARGAILCSEGEGYGLALVEAALCETPGIGVRSGAIPELIAPEETGLLGAPGSVGDLARAIRRLAEDPELAARWGREAARRAAVRTSGPIADRLATAYRRLVPGGPALDAPEADL